MVWVSGLPGVMLGLFGGAVGAVGAAAAGAFWRRITVGGRVRPDGRTATARCVEVRRVTEGPRLRRRRWPARPVLVFTTEDGREIELVDRSGRWRRIDDEVQVYYRLSRPERAVLVPPSTMPLLVAMAFGLLPALGLACLGLVLFVQGDLAGAGYR
ncbi:DUF3592 domain-containing protein [Kitasatospora sp. NPDC058190]|uniref:DUF3592 domain-containing protein n=1 Tax=Kitasatospora sp. NPDC058190 TaxID=3346371 RepID=UPI0036DBDECC